MRAALAAIIVNRNDTGEQNFALNGSESAGKNTPLKKAGHEELGTIVALKDCRPEPSLCNSAGEESNVGLQYACCFAMALRHACSVAVLITSVVAASHRKLPLSFACGVRVRDDKLKTADSLATPWFLKRTYEFVMT